MPRLLSVDDDPAVGELIAEYFGSRGFEVTCVQDGQAMRAEIAKGGIDVVLLDLSLPDEDGLELARHLREKWSGPIIIVSGRGEIVDKIVGLEIGADDYVAKPFDMRELQARVKAVLRRRSAGATPGGPGQSGRRAGDPENPAPFAYSFGGMTLNVGARRLDDGDGREIVLTRGEFDLLLALVERPQRVLTRDQLMEITHNRDASPFDRTIDVQIGRLRRKIGDDLQQPRIIKAVRGLGYQFAMPVSRSASPKS